MELNETQLNAISLLIGTGGREIEKRIKRQIQDLKAEFNTEIAEELETSSFDFDPVDYDTIGNADLAQTLFSQTKESLLDYGGFDLNEVENAVNEINSITREFYSVRRKIRDLEALLG